MFLEKRGGEVLSNVKVAKTRKTLSKVVAGKPITEDDVLDQVKDHIEKNKPPKLKEFNKHNNLLKKSYKKSKNLNKSSATFIPKPGTSGPNENGCQMILKQKYKNRRSVVFVTYVPHLT